MQSTVDINTSANSPHLSQLIGSIFIINIDVVAEKRANGWIFISMITVD